MYAEPGNGAVIPGIAEGEDATATVQTPVEIEATDVAPSPVVLTVALNPLSSTAVVGMLVMVGVEGVARPTMKLCVLPSFGR